MAMFPAMSSARSAFNCSAITCPFNDESTQLIAFHCASFFNFPNTQPLISLFFRFRFFSISLFLGQPSPDRSAPKGIHGIDNATVVPIYKYPYLSIIYCFLEVEKFPLRQESGNFCLQFLTQLPLSLHQALRRATTSVNGSLLRLTSVIRPTFRLHLALKVVFRATRFG